MDKYNVSMYFDLSVEDKRVTKIQFLRKLFGFDLKTAKDIVMWAENHPEKNFTVQMNAERVAQCCMNQYAKDGEYDDAPIYITDIKPAIPINLFVVEGN